MSILDIGIFLCQLSEGYLGRRCERCADGYSGDPMVLGSSCRKREGMSILDKGIVLCQLPRGLPW